MKVEMLNHPPTTNDISDMDIGDIAVINFGCPPYQGQHMIKTYSGYVLLEDPNCTWAEDNINNVVVTILPEGATLKLTV